MDDRIRLLDLTWVDDPMAVGAEVLVQMSAHGRPAAGVFDHGDAITFAQPQRRVAPGQSVVLYQGDCVVGGGFAA